MIRHGEAPFLECSSKGDKRFSAFYARLPILGNKSIEEIYQAAKVFEDGSTGLSIKEAKGRKAINQEELAERYSSLWNLYIMTNMHLLDVLEKASGLSDIFGQPGHVCQATELWRIKQDFKTIASK
jgi:sulfatase maturation enzyme AslB (radical SAM superfamily)